MSQVSCCAGPPHMKSKMHALARRFPAVGAARSTSGNPRPKSDSAPACKKSRRRTAGFQKKEGHAVCMIESLCPREQHDRSYFGGSGEATISRPGGPGVSLAYQHFAKVT